MGYAVDFMTAIILVDCILDDRHGVNEVPELFIGSFMLLLSTVYKSLFFLFN